MKKINWYSLLLLLVLAGTLIERQRILDADPRDYFPVVGPPVGGESKLQTYLVISNELNPPKIYTSAPTNGKP